MTLMHKLVALVIVTAVAAGTGYYYGRGNKQVEVREKIVTVKGETITQYKDRIVTVTRVVRPDGTTEETTRTEDKQGSSEQRTTEKKKDTDTATTSIARSYSLGLKYRTRLSDIPDIQQAGRDRNNYEMTAGYRLMGDVWIQSGLQLDGSVSLGVAYQW